MFGSGSKGRPNDRAGASVGPSRRPATSRRLILTDKRTDTRRRRITPFDGATGGSLVRRGHLSSSISIRSHTVPERYSMLGSDRDRPGPRGRGAGTRTPGATRTRCRTRSGPGPSSRAPIRKTSKRRRTAGRLPPRTRPPVRERHAPVRFVLDQVVVVEFHCHLGHAGRRHVRVRPQFAGRDPVRVGPREVGDREEIPPSAPPGADSGRERDDGVPGSGSGSKSMAFGSAWHLESAAPNPFSAAAKPTPGRPSPGHASSWGKYAPHSGHSSSVIVTWRSHSGQ